MKILIFGSAGQDGIYLSAFLQANGHEVMGSSRSALPPLQGSVGDFDFVEALIKTSQPDFLFHLAANSTTRHDALFDNEEAITRGTVNVLEACYRHSKTTRVFLSGSAVQFQNDGKPIGEESPFLPQSAYAVSRISSVYCGRYYRSLGLKVYVGYFFNHDSPLRSERHLNKRIAATARRIAAGSAEKLVIGDLHAVKEFNFAGDLVEAIWMLVNQEKYAEAVIGSGQGFSILEWIEGCFRHAGLNASDHIVADPGFRSDYKMLVSRPDRLREIGWSPKTGFQEMIDLMMSNN